MSAANVIKYIKEKDAEFVDLRFTDPRGKLQHLTMDSTVVDEGMLNEGVFFDGSSIAGWKAINESDMILKPDTSRMFMDPFTSHNTVVLFCDILDAIKKTPYERDPRGIAKKAEEYLKILKEVGIKVEKHHHEVAPSQHELGMYFGTLVDQADNVQLYKYVVQMVTHSFGKTATFMPKPVAGDNGSGMHIHQSIWKGDTPVFSGDAYAGLSETALHYIGGILKHAKAINAFANSTTNSYKRLIPGFEAPVLLAYSARNRSASCRIPITLSKKGARCEIRFPDASGNPYLTFAAMLMAGIDGIKNKIHPGESFDKDLYELPPEEVKAIPTVCGSLREAMESLDKDREFLTQGGVFTDDQIDAYIALKFEEIHKFEHAPHPVEFEMYYSS